MPRVPDWQPPQTRSGVLPHQGLHAPQAALANPEAVGKMLIKGGRVLNAVVDRLQEEADQPILLDAANKLAADTQRLTYDADEGYLPQRGEAALRRDSGRSLEDEWLSKYDGKAAAIEESLKLERQKQRFRELSQQNRARFQQGLIKHIGAQAQVFKQDALQGAVTLETENSALHFDDPAALAQSRDKIAISTYELSRMQGLPASATEWQLRQNLSAAHGAAFSRLAESGDWAGAERFLAAVQDDLTEQAKGQMRGLLDTAAQKQLGERFAAQLLQGVDSPDAPPGADRLTLAQIGVESSGQVDALSPKGALGLMQLLPETAKEVAAQLGVPFDEKRLTEDATYNVQLGTAYRENMQQRYGGNLTLALAAYNAGPGKVDEWLKTYGDPRSGKISEQEWLQKIPYAETRDYIAKVQAKAASLSIGDSLKSRYATALSQVNQLPEGAMKQQAKTALANWKAATDAQHNALYEAAGKIVQEKGFAALSAAQLQDFSASETRELQHLDAFFKNGTEPATDYDYLDALLKLPAEQLSRVPLAQIRAKLGNSDFAFVRSAWSKAQQGDGSALAAARDEQEQLKQALQQAGILTGDSLLAQKDSKKREQFSAAYAQSKARFLQGKADGYRMTREDTQGLLQGLLQEVVLPRDWWPDKKLPLWQVPAQQRDQAVYNDGDKSIDDVPPLERAQIVEMLRAQGLPPTPARVLKAWADRLQESGVPVKSRTRVNAQEEAADAP